MNLLFIILSVFSISQAYSWTTSEVFKKYPNEFFVETGSCLGNGIQNALDAGCFREIYSIELSPHYHRIVCDRFRGCKNVHLVLGDSSTDLEKIIMNLDGSATFWLDGHYSGGDTAKGNTCSPILLELEAIKKHPINNHTILIDDIRLLGTIHFDYVTINNLIEKLLEINPNYTIKFEDGYVQNDVLVAFIET